MPHSFNISDYHKQGKSRLSENDVRFLERIFAKGITPYMNRLKQYGFQKKDNILDAGCGFGQWSLALAQMNKKVYSCDGDAKRIEFLKEIILEKGMSNAEARLGFIDNLPYNNETFDAVFCYGVIFITPWKKSLAELVRVLKPGGKLYVNANGLGWYKHLWYTEHNKTIDYDPQKIAAEAWLNTYYYQKGERVDFPTSIIIEPDEFISELKKLEMGSIQWDGEGLLGNPQNKDVFFQKEYFGDVGVYEVMATKK
jgi:ubiquinone/menaquinone biosynthesis C-methylase UbiE